MSRARRALLQLALVAGCGTILGGCRDSGLPGKNLPLQEARHREFRYPSYQRTPESVPVAAVGYHWIPGPPPETIPERLQNLLLLWRYQSPWFHDEFDRIEEVFPAASYQYVLYGMGFRTEVEPDIVAGNAKMAERAMRENLSHTERLRAGLPRHRELIRKVVEVGLQSV